MDCHPYYPWTRNNVNNGQFESMQWSLGTVNHEDSATNSGCYLSYNV